MSVSTTTPSQKLTVSTVASQNISDSSSGSDKQKAVNEKDNQSTSIDLQQALNLLEQRNSPVQTSTESVPKTGHVANMVNQRLQNNVATINESIVSTVPNISTSTTTSTFPYTLHDIVTNSAVLKSALRNSSGIPQKLLGTSPIVCSTSNNQVSSMPQFGMQTSSISVYSIPTSVKNNYSNVSQDITTVTPASTATITTTAMSKPMSTGACPIPPCPDAIPISLMKQMSMRKQDMTAKGTNLNEICAKIGSNTIGSKINDICAKIGENSKEKNRVDAHGKSDVPDLLRISAKKNSSPLLPNSDTTIKHIPNIPNIPVYTPSNNTAMENKNAKSTLPTSTSASVLAVSTSSAPPASPHTTQRLASLKKQSQSIGYKTLRDPPKSWNPTLSKNNYVAAKNQAKEMQNQTQTSMSSEGMSKQIPSKPAKIFKMRNMPRYLGNPASGVKPMYGVTNDTKEKEQSTTNAKNATLSMMKIDPKTLSPIVSTINSPIVSPPPYSPNARSYQNTPSHFSRDTCRNTGSPISPRNSPVNMLSTNPVHTISHAQHESTDHIFALSATVPRCQPIPESSDTITHRHTASQCLPQQSTALDQQAVSAIELHTADYGLRAGGWSATYGAENTTQHACILAEVAQSLVAEFDLDLVHVVQSWESGIAATDHVDGGQRRAASLQERDRASVGASTSIVATRTQRVQSV